MNVTFSDHFSTVAAQYAASRPQYPDALLVWLATQTPARALAWDAGCGNGQASVGLAAHFEQVIATDASAPQIANAEAGTNIAYAVRGETHPDLADASVDIVTVAQALHWFDRPAFYREVARVLKPNGVLAVWTYGLSRVDPAIDAVVAAWYRGALDAYWPPERRHTETQYRDIAFPYAHLSVPAFDMAAHWTREQFVAYLRTWSAVKEYAIHAGGDALQHMLPALEGAWPGGHARPVHWPLTLLAGRGTSTQTW